MGILDSIRSAFRGNGKTVVVPEHKEIAAAANQTQSTYDNKNFTFSGDLRTLNYDNILRNKQANINQLYSLADYYVDKDPIFRGIIKGVYTPFSVDKWKLVGADEKTKRKYEQYYERINLRDLIWSVFYQYYKYDNVYLYLMDDGSLITLPPHKVRISNITINGEPVIEYDAGSILSDRTLVTTKAKKDYVDDEEIKVRLAGYPKEVEAAIEKRTQWVQLNPENTFVLQGIKEDWLRYSIPLIASCLVALEKKERIQKYELAMLNLGIYSFYHAKYGDSANDFQPNEAELTKLNNHIKQAMTGGALATTNQYVTIDVVQGDTQDLFQYDKYKDVNAEILSAGGISAVIVSGRADDGASFASAQVSIKTVVSRIRQARDNFCDLMNKVNRRLNGRVLARGADEKIPKFTFPPVDLENSNSFQEACRKLWTEGVVSTKTLLENAGYDVGQEIERRKDEAKNGTDEVLAPRTLLYKTESDEGNNDTSTDEVLTDDEKSPGRPRMDEDERTSDESKSQTGRNPKPSNPEGSNPDGDI